MDRGDTTPPNEEPFEDPEDHWSRQGPISDDDLSGDFPASLTDEEISLVEDGGIRGWIPPDDRLWLHPSEIGRNSRRIELEEERRRARRSEKRGLIAAGVVTSAALTAAIAAVVLATTSQNPVASNRPTLEATHLTSSTSGASGQVASVNKTCPTAWMAQPACAALKRTEPSMIELVVQHGDTTVEGTAVVVPSATAATIAVTSASLVEGASVVEALNPSGRKHRLNVVGVDESTGIGVLRVPWSMPAAPIAEESVTPETYAVLACLGKAGAMQAAMGEIKGADSSTAPLMDSIEAAITPVATPGGLLLDSSGSVLGVLGATQKVSNDLMGEFVPGWLADGVANRIVAEHRVVHGWLDVEGTSDPEGGAVVVSVPSSGPAAKAGLEAGDVVFAISTSSGSVGIDSMADLRARLYLEPPGAHVELDVLRDGQTLTMMPVLSASSHS